MKTAVLCIGLLVAIPLGVLDAAPVGDRLQSASAYTAGSQLSAVLVGDFNRDGNADLLVIDNSGSATNTVHVLLGKGDGTFQAPKDSIATPNLSAVAIGDFNGDGIQDIAVTDSNLNEVTILLGKGDGTFSAKATLSTGADPVAIAAADFNGDGNIDLAVANNSDNTLNIFLGNGDGTFTSHGGLPAASGGSSGPVALAIGDFNGDHKPDIAVALNTNAMSILKGNGDGTFGPATTSIIFNFTNPTAIAAADLNNDGALDLVVLTDKVLFLAGNNNLTFKTPVAFGTGFAPNRVAIGDVNNDGSPDVVVTNFFSESVSVLLNDRHGGFSVSGDYAGVMASGVALGDFNGDGRLDVAVSNGAPFATVNNIEVLLGNGDGTMRGAFSYDYQGGGSFGGSGGTIAADVNSDGQPDLIAPGGSGITILSNSGNYNFTVLQPTNSVAVDVPGGIAAGKMTTSGNLDVVVASRTEISVLPGLGNGRFLSPLIQTINAGTHDIALGDFNRDGNLDVAFTQADASGKSFGVVLGKGDGTFMAPASAFSTNGILNGIAVADFNGDGNLDIAVADVQGGFGNGTVDIFLGKGDGTFTSFGAVLVGRYPASIIPVDLNKDGKLDLVVLDTGNGLAGGVSVFLGHGDGTFAPAVRYPLTSAGASLVVTDINGDGWPDFAVGEGTGMIDLYLNNGDGSGTFGSPVSHFVGSAAFSLFAADLSGGGAPDLIAAGGISIVVVPNAAGTHVQLTSSQNPSAFPQIVTFSAGVTPSVAAISFPTGTVHFAQGATTLGDIPLSGGSASIPFQPPRAGTYAIQGGYAGDANFLPRRLPGLSQVVNKAATAVLLQPASLATVAGDPLLLGVSVAPVTSGIPTGSVSLLDGNSLLASSPLNSSGAASFTISQLALGTHAMTAAYAGDSNYLSATSPAENEQVSASPDFLISPLSPSVTVRAGQSATIAVSISPTLHFTGPMTFSCSGLPALAACSFNPSSLPLGGITTSVTATIMTTGSSLSVRALRVRFPSAFYGVVGFIAVSLACFIMLCSRDRTLLTRGFVVGLVLLSVVLMSCAGGGNGSSQTIHPGTPPGTASVVISASAPTVSGTVTHQSTVVLTVTP
jgi:Big-like domain-containing protein/VCBS repeat protein